MPPRPPTPPRPTRPLAWAPGSPRGPSLGRRLTWWGLVAAVALAGALAGLALAAPELARAALRDRLDRLEARTGRRVTVGTISAPLWGTLALRDVAMTGPDGVTPQLSVARVETDLSLLALAAGRRRPRTLALSGLRARLTVGRRGLEGVQDLLPRGGSPSAPGGARQAVEIQLDDAAVDLRLAIPGVAMPGGPARGIVRITHAELTRGDTGEGPSGTVGSRDSRLRAEARGQVEVAGASVDLRARVADGEASLTFAPALAVPLEVGGRRVVLSLSGVARSRPNGEVSVVAPRLALHDGEAEAEVATLEVATTAGWQPAREAVFGARVEGARGALGGVKGAAELIRFHRGAAGAGGQLVAQGLSLGGARWSVTLARATASLRGDAWVDAAAPPGPARPTEGLPPVAGLRHAVREVVLESPRLTLQSRRDGGGRGAGAQSGPRAGHPASAPSGPRGPRLEGLARRALGMARTLAAATTIVVRDGAVEAQGGPGEAPYGLRGLSAQLRPSPSGATSVAVTAAVRRGGRGGHPTGDIDVRATLDAEGRVERADGRVRGTDLAHLLSRASEYVVVDRDTALDLQFAYTALPTSAAPARPVRRLRGSLRATDLGFHAWRISHEPVRGLNVAARFEGTVKERPGGRVVEVDLPSLRVGEANVEGTLRVSLERGAPPKIEARVRMPRQDCAAVRRSIPASLIPRLKGLQVRGDMEFTATLDVDLARPKELTLRMDGSMDRCQVVSLGGGIDLDALRGRTYVHHPVEPERGRRDDIAVGPGTSQWVRSKLLPGFVKAAAVVTEDRSFTRHKGIRWDLVARALKLDLAGERFIYGGSTITQQLVKNLYLTREKTLSRKLEEAIISMEMERRFTKDQILTLYINVVEYGPDIYGVKRAARFYFGKQPWELSPLEAAFIMGLKPFPKAGFKQWTKQHLNGWWVTRVKKVLEMMYRREHAITWTELQAAAPYQPRFRAQGQPMSGAPAYVPPPPPPADAGKR